MLSKKETRLLPTHISSATTSVRKMSGFTRSSRLRTSSATPVREIMTTVTTRTTRKPMRVAEAAAAMRMTKRTSRLTTSKSREPRTAIAAGPS